VVMALLVYCSNPYLLNSSAVVWGLGLTPGFAASDLGALQAALRPLNRDPHAHPEPRPLSMIEEQPGVLDLERQGRIFTVEIGTRCKVVRREWSLHCQTDSYHPELVRLLDGRRAGSVVWMCSDTVRLDHPPL
jgi:hypothetical protein